MPKQENILPYYAYLDSQRLKETFFSTPPQKNPHKKIIIAAAALVVILAALAISFFYKKYEVVIISRNDPLAGKNISSLLSLTTRLDARLLDKNNRPSPLTYSGSVVSMPLHQKNGIKINFAEPADLINGALYIYAKKSPEPLTMAIVAKDSGMHSNARQPRIMPVTGEDINGQYIKIPLRFTDDTGNTNFYRVNQLTLRFLPQNQDKNNWLLIKNIVLATPSKKN